MPLKLIKQFSVILITFFGVWFLLSRINFINRKQVEQLSQTQENKLGEMMLQTLQQTEVFINDRHLCNAIDSIKNSLCISNKINPQSIVVYIVENEQINAFALPGRKIIIYSALIRQTESAEELAGVMAHEIGHIEKKHILKKLGKEAGVALLFSMIRGNASFGILRELSKTLTSTAFDRRQETEADLFAVQALANSGINPQSMADILFRITNKSKNAQSADWLSTHPNGSDRVEKILEQSKKIKVYSRPPLLKQNWKNIRSLID